MAQDRIRNGEQVRLTKDGMTHEGWVCYVDYDPTRPEGQRYDIEIVDDALRHYRLKQWTDGGTVERVRQ